jgi:hypothetical protein
VQVVFSHSRFQPCRRNWCAVCGQDRENKNVGQYIVAGIGGEDVEGCRAWVRQKTLVSRSDEFRGEEMDG